MQPIDIRTRTAPDLEVPELFGRLRDIAYNLWWSWSPRAHTLFNQLAPSTWQHYRNPIDVLIDLGPEPWRRLQTDGEFTRSYHALVAEFDAYTLPPRPTWFERLQPDYAGGPFAYFSTEYGWHECLQIYSGGLGVLAGDHCKSASDLGLPFVGIGLMYKHGYFRQTIDAEGFQQHFYPDYDFHRLPLLPVVDGSGRELYVAVELPDRQVHLRVWKVQVGRVPVLLLDADLPINHPADRAITSELYVRGREMRLCQELLLGMGGVRVLHALGIAPGAWHLNEGHSALLSLERMRVATENERLSWDEALCRVRRDSVLTVHTPVAAGNEVFDEGLVRAHLAGWCAHHGLDPERVLALGRVSGADGAFNLSALGLRTTGRTNGVSELHRRVANAMWAPVLQEGLPPIEHVDNAVHPPSWIGPEILELLQRHRTQVVDEPLLDSEFAARVEAIPDHELWSAHLAQKRRLLAMIREKTLEQFARHGRSPDELREVDNLLGPDALTICFARRFATYKRAELILSDPQRLAEILGDPARPVQLVFAGKAHPADRPGQDLIRRICQAALTPELRGRVVFLENYDMRVARHLVQGADLWLNTPWRPREASGTSGMKAGANGVLHCSILDGWWCAGYDPSHGWAIGDGAEHEDRSRQDAEDTEALYRLLREEIVPAFHERDAHGLPVGWIRRMKRAIALLTPRFGTARMVREYTERYYLPASRGELLAACADRSPA
jgi:starch phosphorylase